MIETGALPPSQPGDDRNAVVRFESVLRFASARGISDVHVKAGQRPLYRRFGTLISRRDEPGFDAEDMMTLAQARVPPELVQTLEKRGHVTFMMGLLGSGRFRVTALRARSLPTFSVRVVPSRVLSLRELNLPRILANWGALPQGLVLVTGAPGMGKTSTWLGILEQINTASAAARQVVTLESPIEQTLDDKVAFVHQREIGTDVENVASGLEAAQRQDADVLALDGLSPAEVSGAVFAANLQQLVIATVTAAGTLDTLRRLIESVPVDRRAVLRTQLARRLKAIVHQVLVPQADGKGMLPACEILVMTPQVADVLKADKDPESLYGIFDTPGGRQVGMTSVDHSLAELVQSGLVTLEAAMAVARDPEQLRVRAASSRPTMTAVSRTTPGAVATFSGPPTAMSGTSTIALGVLPGTEPPRS